MKIKKKALRSYREALASKGNSIKIENDETQRNDRRNYNKNKSRCQNGNTFYYLTIDADTSRIFNAMSKVSSKLPFNSSWR